GHVIRTPGAGGVLPRDTEHKRNGKPAGDIFEDVPGVPEMARPISGDQEDQPGRAFAKDLPHEFEAILAGSAEEMNRLIVKSNRSKIHGHGGGLLANLFRRVFLGGNDRGLGYRPNKSALPGADRTGDDYL